MAKRKESVLKIVILGDSGVGKSSLLGQYDRQEFDENLMVIFLIFKNFKRRLPGGKPPKSKNYVEDQPFILF